MKIPKLKEKLLYCGLILIIIVIMRLLDITCLFKLLFNIECPGCGITRAYISLFHFDFKSAFEYNPMFWAVPVCLLLYLFDGKLFKKKWLNEGLIVILCAGFFINWIIRLIF